MEKDLLGKFYLQTSDDWKQFLSRKRFSERKLAVKVVERGIVLPARQIPRGWAGGVCDNDFNFIAGFSRRMNDVIRGGFACVVESYSVERQDIVELDEDVIFGGSLIGHFGHFMVECWNRLWYVIQHPELQSKILFITTTHGGYHSWFDDFFRLMGIDLARIIYVDKPTQCRSVTVPDQSQYSSQMFTKEYLVPYQAIKERVTPAPPKKLYLTRANFELNAEYDERVHCFNEKYFEDFFVARGFESVAMEKLQIEEQISLIMGADEIAANLGTLTHWAIFCKPTAKFVMLNRVGSSVSGYQCLINEAFNFTNSYIVDASKDFLFAHKVLGVCMFGSNRYWKNFVADYFGEQIEEDDDRLYFQDALDEYVTFWLKKYPLEKNFNLYVESIKGLCNKITSLEQELNKNRPVLNYRVHVGQKGWLSWNVENQPANSIDQKLDIQAIMINFTKPFHDIYYSVYYGGAEGWSKEVKSPGTVGTTGQSKSIMGIKIWLDEAGAKDFDILYRLHKFDGEWTAWGKNGEVIYSCGQKLNAIQIKLESNLKTAKQ